MYFNEKSSVPKNIFGIEFAPTDIPLERRLQTFSVIVWFVIVIGWPFISGPCFVIPPLILLYFQFYKLFTIVTASAIAYLVWVFIIDIETPHRGGRPLSFVRNWKLWEMYNAYFPIKLIKTSELNPTKNYLFCCHPHGLICCGAWGCFATELAERKLFQGFRFSLLTFDVSFQFPILRDLLLLLGLGSASRRSLNYILSKPGGGNVGVLMPGGAKEALDFREGFNILQLKKRKGFIKVVLQNGASLVPVFAFGENRLFRQINNPRGSLIRWLQDLLQKLLQVPPVPFYGRGIFQYSIGLLPSRVPVNVVVGEPIHVQKVEEPTQKQIDELHTKYMESLTKLYYSYKDVYSAYPKDVLVIT